MVIWPLSAQPDLSLEDKEVKRKLVKCAQRAYSELIRSDIPGSFGARPARLPFLRSSPLSVMKRFVPKSSSPSASKPLTAKPTRGEFRSRLEMLAKKKRSVKRKPPSSPEGCPPARGKTLKVGAYLSPSSAVGAGDSSGKGGGGGGGEGNEPFLEVLPISVWSPTSRGAAPPPTVLDEVTGNRDRSEATGDEDSFLSHTELIAEAVSSILRYSDLRRVGALPVEEALALLL